MSEDDKVIDLVKVLEQRKIEKVKKELDATIYDLDIDIEKILSAFVFFNINDYNDNSYTKTDEKQMVINNLIFTVASLDLLGFHEAAEEIQNVIDKLNNNSYGENNEDQS